MFFFPWLNVVWAVDHAVNYIMQGANFFALIIYVWSVSRTPKRSCACEINLNHTNLHGNGYWLADIATQPYATAVPLRTFLIYSLFCSLREDTNQQDENVILKPTLYNRTYTSSERAFHRQYKGMQRWAYQNWIRYQTISYEAEEMWSPMVHTMKNNVHTRSGTQQRSAEFTTWHRFKSFFM